ncbi:MAG: SufS family cysteine desulfurase [Gemmataceae bacterium]
MTALTSLPVAATTKRRVAPFDVARIRADFPILREKVHGKPLVYLDNAASTQKPRAVIDAINRYYETTHANVHRGVHHLSQAATQAYEDARLKTQNFLGAHCLREIIFTRGTTDAINLVAHSFGQAYLHPGDEVLITWLEHHSNIVPWQLACQARGATLKVVPVSDAGELDLAAFEKLLSKRTRMVAVAHVSNALGTINPIRRIIEQAHAAGAAVLVDGAQAVAHLRVNVEELDCDFYAFSGHKIYGPTGIGALFGKARWLELMPPYQGGGDMIETVRFERTTYNELPYKFEAGTPNVAGAIGLGAALDYVEEIGLDAIALHEQGLLRHATERLQDIPGVRLIGTAHDKAGVLSFVVDGVSNLDAGAQLDLEGIAVRTGHHCCMPLMERYGIEGTARASFAVYNTLEEVDALADALQEIARKGSGRAPRLTEIGKHEPVYPGPAAPTPQAAAEELGELFEFLDDWPARYNYLIELGEKCLPMPEEMKTEANRVHGCQSIVFLHCRKKPGAANVIEFLADSNTDLVRGLLVLLQRLFSGQTAEEIAAFDVEGFFKRLGLDAHLTSGRRNGLAEMVKRIRSFAEKVREQMAGSTLQAETKRS